MRQLAVDDLFTLEDYARERAEFRVKIMDYKARRRIHVGPHATLYFEDRLTIQYQIQEMLRAERIFEPEGIVEELNAYNPLIPGGCNWKATFMLEYEDLSERATALAELVGIENDVWVQISSFPRVTPFADEDMDRSTEEKTAAVHFLRFELTPDMVVALKNDAALAVGIDHPGYGHSTDPVADAVRQSLIADLD